VYPIQKIAVNEKNKPEMQSLAAEGHCRVITKALQWWCEKSTQLVAEAKCAPCHVAGGVALTSLRPAG
jgi:hypothetical protein